MTIPTDTLAESLHQLKRRQQELERETARGNFPDLYKLGRAQGKIDGFEEAILILEGRIEAYLES